MAHPHRYPLDLPGAHSSMDKLVPSPGIMVVDLDALARNYRRLRDAASPAECAAVVKANAYGLGVIPVARRLAREGCRRFFVATAGEGRELRGLLPSASIYVLEGAIPGAERTLLNAGLTPVLNSLEQIDRWRRAGGESAILHVDTGMARLGLDEAAVLELGQYPDRLRGLAIECVMTHLACADTPEHLLNAQQLQRFAALRSHLPDAPTSIANSAGVFLDPAHHGDIVRPGIGLYGGNPFAERASPVEPVVTLSAMVLQVRNVAERTTVGYGATHDAEPPCRLAICGVGYADGYPRAVGNRCDAAFDGVRLPVVGRVSMDLTCVDVSAVPPGAIVPGHWVELIGGTIGLDEVAAAAGTLAYEVLTGLGSRLERRYEGDA